MNSDKNIYRFFILVVYGGTRKPYQVDSDNLNNAISMIKNTLPDYVKETKNIDFYLNAIYKKYNDNVYINVNVDLSLLCE